jgi:S1-C subfamily serine protease
VTVLLQVRGNTSPEKVASSTFLVETGATSGTAFLVEPDIAVTAAHVVEGHSFVGLAPVGGNGGAIFGETLPSFVVYVNYETDLAVLRLLSPSESTPLKLSDKLPLIGTEVSALGAPGGIFQITTGEILGIKSSGLISSTEVAPGNSGGPLVTAHGEVTGLIVQFDPLTQDAISVPAPQVAQFIESVPESAWSQVPSTTDEPLIVAWFMGGFLLAAVVTILALVFFAKQKKKKNRVQNLIRITMEEE